MIERQNSLNPHGKNIALPVTCQICNLAQTVLVPAALVRPKIIEEIRKTRSAFRLILICYLVQSDMTINAWMMSGRKAVVSIVILKYIRNETGTGRDAVA